MTRIKPIAAILAASLIMYGCTQQAPFMGTKSSIGDNVPAVYKVGDTILPNYVCPDTLIVVNARGLNYGMKLYDETYDYTEDQLDSIFHVNCIIK